MSTEGTPAPKRDQVARRWWASLQDFRADGTPNRGRDRAALARLRRASTPTEAVDEPAVFELYKRLGFGEREVERRLPRVAALAAVLAHVRSDAASGESGFRRSFAEMLGHGEQPPMSPLRFKRLLSAKTDQDILVQFRRAVALAGARNIDVGDLAASLLAWDKDERRMRWAFDYHGAGFAAPDKTDPAPTADED